MPINIFFLAFLQVKTLFLSIMLEKKYFPPANHSLNNKKYNYFTLKSIFALSNPTHTKEKKYYKRPKFFSYKEITYFRL